MFPLLNFPNEILINIAEHLSLSSINAFARTNKRCHAVLNRHLYVLASYGVNLYDAGIIWVLDHERIATLKHFLDAGAIEGPDSVDKIEILFNLSASRGQLEIFKLVYEYAAKLIPDLKPLCEEALEKAIKGGHSDLMEFMLAKGVSLKNWPASESTALQVKLANRIRNAQAAAAAAAADDDDEDDDDDDDELDPQTPNALHIAVKSQKPKTVKRLLQCGLDPNATDDDGNAPIHYLAFNYRKVNRWARRNAAKKETLCQVLLDHGADPYLKDQYGLMPLWIASYTAAYDEVRSLLLHGVDPNGLDREGNPQSPIPLEEFKRIVHQNPRLSPFYRVEDGERNCCSPLCIAAYHGDDLTVSKLLEVRHGANPNLPDPNGDLPLHLAVLSKNKSLVELLVQHGASLNAKDCHGRTPLGWAAALGGYEMMVTLLDCGASTQSDDDPEGLDPILHALEYGHSQYYSGIGILPFCIVDTGDSRSTLMFREEWSKGCTCCLDHGEPHDCERVLKSFLEHGSKLDSRDKNGRSILHQAAFQLCAPSVRFLLDQGADPMAKDSFGQIPLHMACSLSLVSRHEKREPFTMLLEATSDPNCKDINGDTPLHMAARTVYNYGVRLLRRDGRADFNARNNRGNSVLHDAVDRSIGFTDEETIVELRKGGTDLTLVNNDGETVWDFASKLDADHHWHDSEAKFRHVCMIETALSCDLTEVDTDTESDDD